MRPLPILLSLALITSGCAASKPTGLQVTTTVSPITSITANLAGGTPTTVTGLIPEGTNSHTFEPPPSAARTLAQTDILFINGMKLEDPTSDLAAANLPKTAKTIRLADKAIPESEHIYDFSFPLSGGKPNPHLWTDPKLALTYANTIMQTLVEADPKHASQYRINYAMFATKLTDLDAALQEASATIPAESRLLLTYHDSFAYFARDYEWKIVGAVQPSSFQEPTPRDVSALITQIREQNVKVVFGSEVFPSPILAQIARETGARYVDELRDDDLPGKPGDRKHTYLALMSFDFTTIIEALGGDASAIRALDTSDVAPDKAKYPQ